MKEVIALYVRLSLEDTDMRRGKIAQSESIVNQCAMLRDYIENSADFIGINVVEFIDDGWSGKNFDRPAFKEMMDLARHRKINCIIVKDISRLGRDYLVVGNYLSRVFPFLEIRFIALNDNYDSNRSTDINSLDASFKTLIYDLYSRDLSQKVKSAKLQKAQKGEFLSPYAPFGYKKNSSNKNRLEVDDGAADIVKSIFNAFLSGKSTTQIARELNNRFVPTPMLYKRLQGCSRENWPSIAKQNFWTKGTVRIILSDERYTGKVTYGTKRRKQMGINRVVSTAKENWVVVDDMHEAIISWELFCAVQSKMKKVQRCKGNKREYMLRSRVFCGMCSHAIPREAATTKYAYYVCETKKYFSSCSCPPEKIWAEDLEQTILYMLHEKVRLCTTERQIQEAQEEKMHKELGKIRQDILNLKEHKTRLENSNRKLYEAFVEGRLEKESYIHKKNCLRDELSQIDSKITSLQGGLEKPINPIIEKDEEDIVLGMIDDLVDKVYIYPGFRIDVKLTVNEEWAQISLPREVDKSS